MCSFNSHMNIYSQKNSKYDDNIGEFLMNLKEKSMS